MHIVSDRGMDLMPSEMDGLKIHMAPLRIHLDGRTYLSGVDIQTDDFYRLVMKSKGFPSTSEATADDFAQLYRKLASTDPNILSIHISSSLSKTVASARVAVEMVPEANVTIVDTKTLSAAQGWQVYAAARAAKAGWPLNRIMTLLERIRAATETIYTVATLKYLVHGGRISHLTGLLASVLDIKPLLGVDKIHGNLVERGRARSMDAAIVKMVDTIKEQYPLGTAMRLQIVHGHNPEGAAALRGRLSQMFQCSWCPTTAVVPVLGAHAGPGMVGVMYAPKSLFPRIP